MSKTVFNVSKATDKLAKVDPIITQSLKPRKAKTIEVNRGRSLAK